MGILMSFIDTQSWMNQRCNPKDIALKCFFLGPAAENQGSLLQSINEVFKRWILWRKRLFPQDGAAISESDQNEPEFKNREEQLNLKVKELISRYESEMPTFSPRCMGHMSSEISIAALLGHLVALLHNPNNVASEVSRVGVEIEREAIADLASMLGWDPESAIGHFTSGGSVANFEAIYRAREWFSKLFPKENGLVFIPKNRHYSWLKGCKIFGIRESEVWQIDLNEFGAMDPNDLKKNLEQAKALQKKVMLVVSVMGSTELGCVDPIDEVCQIIDECKNDFRPWVHVDAAYGGFFASIEPEDHEPDYRDLKRALVALTRVDSLTLDPHKLAYVPYACGAFICKEQSRYCIARTDAPYLENSTQLDRGLFTLEGSRAATGPSATWISSKTMGFHKTGLGGVLRKTFDNRKIFEQALCELVPGAYVIDAGSTNILGLVIARKGEPLSKTNLRNAELYRSFSSQAKSSFILSKTVLHARDYERLLKKQLERWSGVADAEELIVLRFCLMNPFLKSKEMERNFFRQACVDLKTVMESKGI